MNTIGQLLKVNEQLQSIVLKGFDPVSSGGFTQVPNILIRSTKLASLSKIVYAQLLSYAWTNDYCFPGQERLAQDTGSSRTTIYRAIKELQSKGWLEVQRRGQGKTNIYVLKYVVEGPAKNVDKPRGKRT